MHIGQILVTLALGVPPGHLTLDHTQPGQWGQPVVRRYEQRALDDSRRSAYELYVAELDRLWAEYRAAGSTRSAWESYKLSAAAARRCYIYQDPFFLAQQEYPRKWWSRCYCDTCRAGEAPAPVMETVPEIGSPSISPRASDKTLETPAPLAPEEPVIVPETDAAEPSDDDPALDPTKENAPESPVEVPELDVEEPVDEVPASEPSEEAAVILPEEPSDSESPGDGELFE